jgi:biotin carboxyl carrier protein
MKVIVDGKENQVQVEPRNGKGLLNHEPFHLKMIEDGPMVYRVEWKGQTYQVQVVPGDDPIHPKIRVNGNTYSLEIVDKFDELLKELGMENLVITQIQDIKSPMPGLVLEVNVEAGQEVKKGDPLLILEAMKMENVIKASADAVVDKVFVKPGEAVEKDLLLISFKQ